MGFPFSLCLAAVLFLSGVDKTSQQTTTEPADQLFFPIPPFAVQKVVTPESTNVEIQLSHPFSYFGKNHTKLYLSMNGLLSFEPLFYNFPVPNLEKDIIYPLWAEINTYSGGNMSYAEVEHGPLLQQATKKINHMFPGLGFNTSWVFVVTWDGPTFDGWGVNVQVILISDRNSDRSFIIMNYGIIPYAPEIWLAGYHTQDQKHKYRINVPSTYQLSETTNVGLPGCWAFRVYETTTELPSTTKFTATITALTTKSADQLFFPIPPFAVKQVVTRESTNVEIQLSHPFSYFGKDYTKLYLSMNGLLSFEPLFYNFPEQNLEKDIIYPLWAEINTYSGGNMSYAEVEHGPLLEQATKKINNMFPGLGFNASWVFVATWDSATVDGREVNVQVILISDRNSDLSFIIMNYGNIPYAPEIWLAGYHTQDQKHKYRIKVPSTYQLSESTNVGLPGCWAFRVDACSALNCSVNEECRLRNGIYGCGCSDKHPRFNADTFDAQTTCNSSNGMVSLSRCELFEAGFPMEFLHLNDASCEGKIQNDRVVFTFDNKARSCGTEMQSNATHFIYENAVRMPENVNPGSVISRDGWLDMKFSCVYPLIQSISMPMSIHATGSVINKTLPGTESVYQLRMVTYSNSSFSTPFSGEVTIEVNQQVFIAVETDGIDSSEFAVVLDSCWATPNNSIDHPIRWDLIINECPNKNDGTVQLLQNGVGTASHFSFRMFTFTKVSDNIFLHCQVHLCQHSSHHCARQCNDLDNDELDIGVRRRRSVDFHDKASISMSF